MFFDEAYDLIKTAWTQESFSFHGDFFSVPPRYLKWGHAVTEQYFETNRNGHRASDVLGPEEDDRDPDRDRARSASRPPACLPAVSSAPEPATAATDCSNLARPDRRTRQPDVESHPV